VRGQPDVFEARGTVIPVERWNLRGWRPRRGVDRRWRGARSRTARSGRQAVAISLALAAWRKKVSLSRFRVRFMIVQTN